MNRYIDRKVAANVINSIDTSRPFDDKEDIVEQAIGLIDHLPSADVVEVVRCKDCKYYYYYGKTSLLIDDKNVKAGWCRRRMRYDEDYRMLPDDYCSYGEHPVFRTEKNLKKKIRQSKHRTGEKQQKLQQKHSTRCKLNPIANGKYSFICPNCKKDLGIEREDIYVYDMCLPKHCVECGQALDWDKIKRGEE